MNKQIEEMANDLAKICPDLVENFCGQVNCVTHLTLSLTKLGYRKTSSVAREIFEEIENLFHTDDFGDFVIDHMDFQELKRRCLDDGR